MTFSLRLLYIAVFQVILTAVITYFLVTDEYRKLSNESLRTLEHFLKEQKQQELKNYTSLAISAVENIYQHGDQGTNVIKLQVANMLGSLLYNGEDGYFFVYDDKGIGISHPKEPFRVGKNWWDLEDNKGEKIIQILINNAKNGGGFYYYPWHKPSSNQVSQKMSYSVYLTQWNWMIGTGVYLDDVNNQLNKLQQEIDLHIDRTKQIILLVAMSSIAFIFLFGLVAHLNQKKKSDLKIDELGQKIINLQEEERRHISRELHDGIVQILVSIKYSIEATGLFLTKEKLPKPVPLLHAEANLSTAIQEIRRISHHLHPRILDELGLSSAMDSLAAEFSERTRIKIKVTKPAVRKLLPDHISTTLYRVVQESLTNIEKHAEATEVSIDLSINKKWLTLTIIDNGQGFDTEPGSNKNVFGIGLRNLAERVEYHCGQFEYHSSSQGTAIKARIPTASFVNYFNQTIIKDSL